MLDRLLELNHASYAEEIRQGLHAKKKPKPKRTKNTIGRPVFDGSDPIPRVWVRRVAGLPLGLIIWSAMLMPMWG